MSDLNVIKFSPEGPDEGLSRWPEIPAEELVTAPPVEHGHEYFQDETGQLSAGIWHCTPFQTRHEPYSVDEFMLVLEGSIILVYDDDDEEIFSAGECFVIPKGTPCSWKQTGDVRKFYLIFDDGTPAPIREGQRAIRCHPESELPSLVADPARFTGQPPEMSQLNIYQDSTGQFLAGIWEATSLELVPATIGRSEFAWILQGHAEVVNGDNIVFTASEGDSFLVPRGMGYQWRHEGTVTKIFCSFTPST